MSFLNRDTPPAKDTLSMHGNEFEDESVTLKPDLESFDPRSFLSLLSQMQVNLDENTKILTTLVDERHKGNCPFEPYDESIPFKRLKDSPGINIEAHVASMKAIDYASENAKCSAAEAAHFNTTDLTASNAVDLVDSNAAETAALLATGAEPITRPSEDDAIRLFGGQDLTDNESGLQNEDLLTSIDESLMLSDEKGPAISNQLAKIVDNTFTTEFDAIKRKEISEKYQAPKNCESLFAPWVNTEIWGKLSTNAKRNDIKFSAMQDCLLRVTSALSVSIDGLLSSREKKTIPVYKDIITQLIDSVALLGHINREISFKRRDFLQPSLSHEFKQVCSRTLKPGKLLFGDDLTQTLQQVKATNKIVNSLSAHADQNLKYNP